MSKINFQTEKNKTLLYFLRAENSSPYSILATDKGLEGLNLSSRIDILLALLGIYRTVF